ncbi:alpha/beta fold hydrolase [Roseovarius aestuariivivens]|uniref:alpha/beta fold hydrolase n=1 Tax=Roseovarius aestuariivivens TaxID=1888910 RepID=UPI001080207A|nr:alpha/beta hydrolase [Roseovarius aestuariivivens]
MGHDTAPLYADLAEGPEDGTAFWIHADDGVRLRAAAWRPQDTASGTVLLFPGRTEYVEKYGRIAADFASHGLATLAIDWRGQGLSDRLTEDEMAGHVHLFADYQRDVAAMCDAAAALDLPKPWYLLAHSMGGCIGLRAVMNGLPVTAAAFSAPMWGIRISRPLRPVAWSLSWSSRGVGLDHVYAPGTASTSYVLTEPFETNKLTTDRESYDYMIRQVSADPRLGLGGPSLRWLYEALRETRALSRLPSPALPCLTLLGTEEDIVDPGRIRERISRWPGARLDMIEGARHEVLMEGEATRRHLTVTLARFFARVAATPGPRSDAGGPAPESPTPLYLLQQGIA